MLEQRHRLPAVLIAAMLLLICMPAAAITGTWSGSLRDESGKLDQVTFRFSPEGRLVLRFASRPGPRLIELTKVGQIAEWVRAGGGVSRGEVRELSVTPTRVQAVFVIFTDSNVGGSRLSQTTTQFQYDFVQEGDVLLTTIHRSSESANSGGGFSVSASQSRSVLRGQLRRSD